MFWRSNFESIELLPIGSSFEIKFDTLEEEYARSLRFPQLRRKVETFYFSLKLVNFLLVLASLFNVKETLIKRRNCITLSSLEEDGKF